MVSSSKVLGLEIYHLVHIHQSVLHQLRLVFRQQPLPHQQVQTRWLQQCNKQAVMIMADLIMQAPEFLKLKA
jgi:hypothetical protein